MMQLRPIPAPSPPPARAEARQVDGAGLQVKAGRPKTPYLTQSDAAIEQDRNDGAMAMCLPAGC